MAKAINTMKKQELVDYIVKSVGNMAEYRTEDNQLELENELKGMLKKELVVRAKTLADNPAKVASYFLMIANEEPADAPVEEPVDAPVEEPVEETVLDASSAEYFHMHFQAGFKKGLEDGTELPQVWGCAVTFRKLASNGKWICQKSSTRNLAWMTKPKVVYAGKYEKGVEREVVSVTERDIKVLKYWLTSGRYGETMSQYFSNDELPNYDACEIGKPIAKAVLEGVREESDELTWDPESEIPF